MSEYLLEKMGIFYVDASKQEFTDSNINDIVLPVRRLAELNHTKAVGRSSPTAFAISG
ncbi:hypothetical protein [Lihuaxuella thermophila]|uniref:Uncharacterized protein n=1 Tax=Lihuaxuella thermophila TaxID=1173111 RepID=A0A1H8ERS1_9BACL|nr:hypothetical protein [Lihuaxuella thermophila]SEN22193.1 hypothetical protein SAMN05444955_107137 [Lihuaxuella thermophila]